MKKINNYINEKLKISPEVVNTKPSKWFTPEDVEEYAQAIDDAIAPLGYMTVAGNHNIDVFRRGTPQRRQTFKNLVCFIQNKEHIDFGSNDNLKSILEKPILDAIKNV